MRPWPSRRWLTGPMLLGYLALTHAATFTGNGVYAQAAWLCLAALVVAAFPGAWGLAAGALLCVALFTAEARTLLKFPPVVFNLLVAAWFGRTLAPGEEPMISWFARVVRGAELPPDLARYTRNSTLMWTLFLCGMAAIAAALALFATPETWSVFANGVDYLLLGALFVGEYVYRRVRYREHAHAPLAEVARTIARAGALTPRRGAGR